MRCLLTSAGLTLARRLTVEDINATVAVSSHGDVSIFAEGNKDCGLKGGCKSPYVACSLFDTKYCPMWEAVVANAPCVLPNAPELCCDSVPAPCVQQWESSGKIGVYCSDSSSCRKPACSQRDEYLEDMHSAEMAADKKFAKCFFASGQSQCDNKKSNFGSSLLSAMGSGGALLERAEAAAPALEEEVSMDSALSEKDDVTTSENNIATSGVVGNEEFVNFAETGAGSCVDRAGKCAAAIESGTAAGCTFCLEAGDSAPECNKNNLKPADEVYCQCVSR